MNRAPLLFMSCLALFVSLSGLAHAQRATITGENILDGTVTGADIKYGSLTRNDLATDSVTAAELDLNVFWITGSSSPEDRWTAKATCPAGSTVLGGGGGVSTEYTWESDKVALTRSNVDGNGWTVEGGPIPYPAQKSDWEHAHDPSDALPYRTLWKTWVWKDDFRVKGKWSVTATAICVEL